VILLDVNVLLYAYDKSSEHHDACCRWLQTMFDGEDLIGLPSQTVIGFVRVVTNPGIVKNPLGMRFAVDIVDSWFARSRVVQVEPGARFWQILRDLMVREKVQGKLVPDAALAAMALEQGGIVCSADRDFRRFSGLKLIDPTEPDSSRA
jgi:uncharacterized protein